MLVTGANRGIGFKLCSLLAQKNFKVLLTSRDSENGSQKVQDLVNQGLDVHFVELDVSNFETLAQTVSSVVEKFGFIDILVNNAGIYIDSEDLDEFPSFLDVNSEIFLKTIDTNLFGPMLLTQLFIPFIQRNGLVINISSGMGKINTSDDRSGHVAYRCSKASLNAFSRGFKFINVSNNVKIISMCPGWVRTEMGGENAPRSLKEGANDILELILNKQKVISGSFYYNFTEQKL